MNEKEKEFMKYLASLNKPTFTYKDYKKISETVRCELIDGEIYYKDEWGDMQVHKDKDGNILMMAAPSTLHQEIVLEIATQLKSKLKDKKCKTFVAPTDLILDKLNTLEPDIMVVCDESKITSKGIKGTPDVIFEIISKGSIRKDKIQKYTVYGEFGVPKYIMVDAKNKEIIVCTLNDVGYYDTKKISINDDIVLKNCTISLKEFVKENKELFK